MVPIYLSNSDVERPVNSVDSLFHYHIYILQYNVKEYESFTKKATIHGMS